MSKTIVIIAQKSTWRKAQKTGEYMQSTVDSTLEEVGFIHCSFPSQTLEIANRRFGDRDDLILLLIDEDTVKVPIKHEGALSGRAGTFPHIYGPLNVDAVYATIPLQKNKQGEFIEPWSQFTKYDYLRICDMCLYSPQCGRQRKHFFLEYPQSNMPLSNYL